MSDSFNPERKSVCLKKQNLFGSGYAGLGRNVPKQLLGTGFVVNPRGEVAALRNPPGSRRGFPTSSSKVGAILGSESDPGGPKRR
jgi:hypothetical protein